jgi:prepilin-type processing-associated H-X9-DG protein
MCRVCMERHGLAINVVFLDGHAATVPLAQLWQLQWSPMSQQLPCPVVIHY